MFSESAEFYDLIYSTFKDYPAESARIATLLRELDPHCETVLDVGCGTGEHARLLAAAGFVVDGLDLDPALVRIAEQKHRSGRFFVADMSDFHVPHRYDAVLCLFSSIGYLRTLDRVRQALLCFRDHLAPGGFMLVEPWFAPGVLDPNRITQQSAEANGISVSRSSRMRIEGGVSRLHFEYEITDAFGTKRATEVHELGLFTSEELLRTFQQAGLRAEYDRSGLTGRGLYIART